MYDLITMLNLTLQNFLVDVKGPALAFLPVLAFEGGTRRNIPKFEVGINNACVFITRTSL